MSDFAVVSASAASATASPDRDALFETQGLRILIALRRIIRAVDIHSRRLNEEFHVTAPQMICLYCLDHDGPMTQSRLAGQVNLGASTVNGIIDRLESKGLVVRTRSTTDRRKVYVTVSPAGRRLTEAAPALLQDRLAERLQELPEDDRTAIAMSLERIVTLMEADTVAASPNLVSAADLSETQPKGTT